MFSEVIAAYNEAVFDTDRGRALQVVQDALAQGVAPEDVLFKVVAPALELMIQTVSGEAEFNLAQHFMASQIAAEVTEAMLSRMAAPPQAIGRVVIGTAPGDFHSLGKRIVVGCLKARMVDAIDLGLDVTAERFVDAAVERGAAVIGISSMMMHTATGPGGCLKVRQLLRERGLEDKIKVAVGGAPYRFDPELYHAVQADAWASDGVMAGRVIADLIKEA